MSVLVRIWYDPKLRFYNRDDLEFVSVFIQEMQMCLNPTSGFQIGGDMSDMKPTLGFLAEILYFRAV